jgi:hypothetical protein
MVSFGKIQKTKTIIASCSKAITPNNMASCEIAGASTCIPVAGYNDKVSIWNVIDNFLEFFIEFVFNDFICV